MTIKKILEKYIIHFPESNADLSLASKQCSVSVSDAELISRKNFVGHFTSSVFVVCPKKNKVLLLRHKSLNMLLQPGGHIESTDVSPYASAIRELREETGIDANHLQYEPLITTDHMIPLHINSHYIPENKAKHEPGHYHHDLEYLFVVDELVEIRVDKNESTGFGWFDWREFCVQKHFQDIAPKIEEIISGRSASKVLFKVQQGALKDLRVNKIRSLDSIRCI